MTKKFDVIQSLQKISKLLPKTKDVIIDNVVFKLHYQWTVLFLLTSIALVTLQEYFGNHIDCIADAGVPIKVINTFCFFRTTFTVVKHYDESHLQDKVIPHPGIGPNTDEDPVLRHAYYQWVPFVLFLQSVMFYIPHYIWKNLEGGRLSVLVMNLKFAPLSGDIDIELKNCVIPSKEKRIQNLEVIQDAFLQRLHINRPWASGLILCEILNAVNLCLQIYILHVFLGGNFINLGVIILGADFSKEADPLEFIFPKMTKCLFHKFGPSGSIQTHDALCVMSLNVINEKIYTFLWFWLLFLTLITAAGLLWRLLAFILHSRSNRFNAIIFRTTCPKSLDPWNLVQVTDECHFSDWIFLRYLSKNLDDNSFREVFQGLVKKINENAIPERINFYDGELQPLKKE